MHSKPLGQGLETFRRTTRDVPNQNFVETSIDNQGKTRYSERHAQPPPTVIENVVCLWFYQWWLHLY